MVNNSEKRIGLDCRFKDRVRTDVRLPSAFVADVEEVCDRLGIVRNAFYSLAAGYFLARLAPLMSTRGKRKHLLEKLSQMFLKTVEDAKKSA